MTKDRKAPIFILDISRLLSRAGQTAPTGIDRVEFAYAEYLLTHHATQTHFAAFGITGRITVLPNWGVHHFIQTLTEVWNLGQKSRIKQAARIGRYLKLRTLFPSRFPSKPAGPVFYLLVSHHHLMSTQSIQRFLRRTMARFIPMVHDLIPIEYPEYATPREPRRHKARMKTVIALAEQAIVPTDYVKKSLEIFAMEMGHPLPKIWVVSHGVYSDVLSRLSRVEKTAPFTRPYFVYLSTIEPRKNHLLLLHIWRHMVATRGEKATPYLILMGKRGWEIENILDLLERSPALQKVVKEKNNLSDEEVITMIKYSSGLLFPSFTEGYGLPLAEALALATPSICADIPALREVGGNIPVYCDPLDAISWQNAIDDFATRGPLWRKQKEQLQNWVPYTWSRSIADALSHCSHG